VSALTTAPPIPARPVSAPPVGVPHAARKEREWTPHIWEGCDFFAWVRLLADNRFAVHWSKLYVAACVTPASVFNSAMRLFQELLLGRSVERTPMSHAPLFILGHWRTGTTYLHELLIRDPRHAYPTTYQCFAPGHFLITESWLPKVFFFFMPSRRPMDNMPAGWDRPQEDEFGLCLLGAPSPYARFAFPNRPHRHDEALDQGTLGKADRRQWERHFCRLIRQLNYKNPGKRLVLKSPPHTCRIPEILKLFPDARFVHIVRDPFTVFPSTVNLWRTLYRTHGLQRPTFAGLEESVFCTFTRMYERFEADRKLIPDLRLVELRYEDLVRDPIPQIEALYHQLDLGDFEPARAPIAAYLAGVRNYETNRYELTPAQRDEIARRWGAVVRRYGYG
jgi:omega-hydroxy-beta-dihydromenaquinone-9 sulfotransferase